MFTQLLNTTPHFGRALDNALLALESADLTSNSRLTLLIKGAYYAAFVKLSQGETLADEALMLEASIDNYGLRGYALCAKAINLYRIGFTEKAKACAADGLQLFQATKDLHGVAEANYLMSTMVNLTLGLQDTVNYLQPALDGYKKLGDATGCFLVRIQQAMVPMYEGQFDKGVAHHKGIEDEIKNSDAYPHLQCIIYHHLAHGLYLKQDLHASKLYTQSWNEWSVATGNFHDFTRTNCMLAEYCRQEKLDSAVVQKCIDAIAYCVELGSYYGYATSSFVMGNICMDQGQFKDAIDYYHKVNEAAQTIQYFGLHHMALAGLGAAQLKLGEIAKARDAFGQLLENSILTGDILHQIAAQRALAELALEMASPDLALSLSQQLFDTAGDYPRLSKDYANFARAIAGASNESLAQAAIDTNQRDSHQLKNLERCLGEAIAQKHGPDEASAYLLLADYYENVTDFKTALQYRKKYLTLYVGLVNAENTEKVSSLRLKYEGEKKDIEIAFLKKHQEEELLRDRLRISRDLHDDMGATLSAISVYSNAIKQRIIDGRIEDSFAMLDTISADARDMVTNMSDMVWMINPQNDRFEKLLDRMEVFAGNVLAGKDIICRFTKDTSSPERKLKMEARKNIYLIFKEAINNIAKYADATEVAIHISLREDAFEMTISDNGQGFEMDKINHGNGLENIHARAKDLAGDCRITSQPGNTIIWVACSPHN